MKITGLGEITKKFDDLKKFTSELDGNIGSFEFDAFDAGSIQLAINNLYSTIDEKVDGFNGNDMISNLADQLKTNGRQAILDRASELRIEQGQQE